MHGLRVSAADVISSIDTVDRDLIAILFSTVCLAHHAEVRLRSQLAAGLGPPWTRDGVSLGCLLSMSFMVALCVPWYRHLGCHV